MQKFANQNLDMTIGAAVAMLIGNILRQNQVEFGAEMEVALGMLVMAVLARFGIKIYAGKKEAEDA